MSCACARVYIRIYFAYSTSECVHMSERISACIHEPQTPCLSMYGYAGCFKVGVGWGDFHSSLNHMNRNSGSSGLRPGLGGNQQHMNNACVRRKGDEGGGKERKGRFPV